MRITKTIAEEVAVKLLAKKDLQIKKAKDELSNFAEQFLEKTLPKEVLETYKKFKPFFRESIEIIVDGNGLSYEYIELSKRYPYGNSKTYLPNEVDAKTFRKLIDKRNDLVKQRRELKEELSNAIFNLKTYKAVQENFPEAFEFLPKENKNTALAINISEIRQKIK